MIGLAAVLGVGLGLAYFGGLRLTTCLVLAGHGRRWLPAVSLGCRLTLAAATFWALAREGVGPMLAALAGVWVARGFLLWGRGGPDDGR
jgi:hypothetical protein